jgi:DNA-binding CsgD family transcriptional regulator
MHLAPDALSLWSATVKYFVPATIAMTLGNLTLVLGGLGSRLDLPVDSAATDSEPWGRTGGEAERADRVERRSAAYTGRKILLEKLRAQTQNAEELSRLHLATAEALALTGADLLAAEGIASKEIGERLFLSARTVDNHLQRVYTKLGVTKRADLAEALRQRGEST